MIDVHVVNQHSADVQVQYAGEARREWIAAGLRTTTHKVPRALLRYSIRLRIVRGGMDYGSPLVDTEIVSDCDATLFVGGSLTQSDFCGADVRR
jgi:hypothetical protein